MSYPGVVALSRESDHWEYKSFPQLLPLYIFSGEPQGQSACDAVCAAVWPIIRAAEGAKPLGLWTVVKRSDGLLQWAYKGQPVYTYFEDGQADHPHGVGKAMDWYLDDDAYAYLTKAGVQIPRPAANSSRKKTGDKRMTAEPLVP